MRNQVFSVGSSQDLSSAALSLELDLGQPQKLTQALLKASVNITETVTVKYISPRGTNYTHTLKSTDLSGEKQFVFRPTGDCIAERDGKFKIECTDGNGTGTVYAELQTIPA